MGGAEEYPHALVVSSSGQGHVSGCMLLSRSLAALGFKVTFIYFSSYYAKLKADNRLVLPYSSHMAEGQDYSSQNSTTNGHHGNGSIANGGAASSSHLAMNSTTISNGSASNGLIEIRVVEDGFEPGDINKHFFGSTPTMKENLFNLIVELQEQGTPPTCLISDSFAPWTLHVAKRAGIPRIDFWTSNAMSFIIMANLPPLYSQGIFPEKGSSTQ